MPLIGFTIIVVILLLSIDYKLGKMINQNDQILKLLNETSRTGESE